MTHPPCLRLCPAHPGNPRSNIEGESPLAGKGIQSEMLGLSISRLLFPTIADAPPRPERRLGLVEAIGHAAVRVIRRLEYPLWVPLPHLLARAAHPIVAWEADRIALGVARSPTLAARFAPKVRSPRLISGSAPFGSGSVTNTLV